MLQNCVKPLSELSIVELGRDIDSALRDWNAGDTGKSPIEYLRLFHNQRRLGNSAKSATIHILVEAITELKGPEDSEPKRQARTDLEDANLLVEHYQDGATLDQLCTKYTIGMHGLNGRLTRARKKLAGIVYQKEIKAHVEHQLLQLQRLEMPLQHPLIGASLTRQQLKDLVCKPGPPFLIAVKGKGGDGKTTIADHVLRDVISEEIWDQVVWISAQQERLTIGGRRRELGQPILTREALIERLFEQFFPANSQKPDSFSVDSMLAKIVGHLKQCPCCICIDSAEAAADIDTLLPTLEHLINPSKVILTTRESLSGHSYLPATIELSELDERDALTLMREIAHSHYLLSVQALSDQDFHRIYRVIGGNPLVIGISAGLVEKLGVNQTLDYLNEAGSNFDAVLKYIYLYSWEKLDGRERAVLLAMPLLSPQGGDYALLSAITLMSKGELVKALNRLISLSLVQTRSRGNQTLFWIHNLTRTFLHEEVLNTVAPLSSDKAELPDFSRYIERAIDFVAKEIEHSGPILLDNEREQARHILSYALDLASDQDEDDVWRATRALLLELGSRFELSGFRAGWLPYVQQAVAVSKERSDQQGEAVLQAHLALLLRGMGNYEAAHVALQASATHFAALGDTGNLADVLTQRAHIYCLQRRHHAARPFMQQVLELLSEGDPRREYVYYLEGLIALNENDPVTAEQWFRQSLEMCQQQGNKRLTAKQLGVIGTALYTQNQLEQAQKYYEESIAVAAEVQDSIQEAVMEIGIGIIWRLRGHPDKAVEQYVKAEPILRNTDEAWYLAMLDTNWGVAKRQLGEWKEAEERLSSSIDRWQYLGDSYREANSHYELGLLYREQLLVENAREAFRASLTCLSNCELGPGPDPLHQQVIDSLGSLDGPGGTS